MATWDPSNKDANVALSNGDLTFAKGDAVNAPRSVKSTSSKLWGRLYVEVVCDIVAGALYPIVGIAQASAPLDNYCGFTGTSGWGFDSNARTVINGSFTSIPGGVNFVNGDVMMLAYDFTAGKAWQGRNGTWFNSADPAAGTNPHITGYTVGSGLFLMGSTTYNTVNATGTANFGASAFTYTAPTGFRSWNTDEGIPLHQDNQRVVRKVVSLHNRHWL